MKQQMKSSIAMYMKELKDFCRTLIITCIDSRALSRRATRSTRKVLRILMVLKADRPPPPPASKSIAISTRERSTTAPSRIFIGSDTYFLNPIAKS
jgi:hypothetical protein